MAKERRISALDRAIQSAMGEERVLGLADDPAHQELPELWRWMSTTLIGRDRIKQPASLTIRLGPEGVLVTLTDRDLSCSFDVSCLHLRDALQAMEAALSGDRPPMRSWGKREPQLRKRRSSGQ